MAGNSTARPLPSDLAPLPDGWSYSPLGELADEARGICYGIVQPGAPSRNGVPIVRVNNIRNNRVTADDALRVSQEIEGRYARSRLRGGEVVLTLVGSLGESAVVPPDLAGWNVARAVGVIPVVKDIGARWVQFCLRSIQVQHFIRTWATTTVQATFNLRDLARLPIPIPPPKERAAITAILGALDDKIELNRRMNRTLEGMARAIFQSWFVDFDPVRAKAAGQQPAGLKPEIAALFPDAFEESELGEIPKGWRVTTLGEVCARPQYGFTESASDEPIGPHFLRITDINKHDWIEWASVPFCKIDDGELAKYRLSINDVVIARMADPGHGALIEEDTDAVFASYLIRFRPLDGSFGRYLQYWLRSENYWHLVHSRQSGTTRANLNAQVLAAFVLLMPTAEILRSFAVTIDALRAQLIVHVQESQTLAALRDALLPKLVSGELRVPKAERIVGGVA